MTTELTSTTHCPDCGSILPTGPLAGFCPQCLLDSTLASVSVDSSSSADSTQIPFAPILPCRFAQYQLLEIVGRGAAGTVFRARDESLGREVAIKALHSGPLASRESIRRFFNEARVAARLSHPHIAPVYEVAGGDQVQPFVVMPFLPGGNLADRLKTRTAVGPRPQRTPQATSAPRSESSQSDLSEPLITTQLQWGASSVPPSGNCLNNFEAIAQLLHKIASAVHHAHQHGVLHRDLKPANILFDSAGEPYVADFGLARVLEEESTLTLDNTVLGTPAYMSPEQATGSGDYSTASDIYSLGAILYELLTGRPPFLAPTIAATLRAIVEDAPQLPPSAFGFRTSDLTTICLKCLEKDPSKRYPTAQSLADDLQRFLNNEPIIARPITRTAKLIRWSQRNPALATAYSLLLLLILLLLLGSPLAIYRINQARKAAETARRTAQIQALNSQRNEYAADMLLARQVLESTNRGRAVDLIEKYRTTGSPGTAGPAPANDVRHWEWHYMEGLLRGDQKQILRGQKSVVTSLAFSPDGRWLASAEHKALVKIWDTRDYHLAAKLVPDGPEVTHEIYSIAFSPNGDLLAVAANVAKEVCLWTTDSWKPLPPLHNKYRVTTLAFSPDGRMLAAGGHGGVDGMGVWDLARREVIADWPLEDVPRLVAFPMAFSPDSTLLAFDFGQGPIGRWDVRSRKMLPPITGHKTALLHIRFNPASAEVLTFDDDQSVHSWSWPDWHPQSASSNVLANPLALALDDDLIVSTHNQDCRLSEFRSGKEIAILAGHTESPSCAAISLTNGVFATAGYDLTIRIWPLKPMPKEPTELALPNNLLSGNKPGLLHRLSSNGRWHARVLTNHTFVVVDMERLVPVAEWPWPWPTFDSIDVAANGKIAAIGGTEGEFGLIDLATGQILQKRQFGTSRIPLARFSPDASLLAIGRWDKIDPGSGHYFQILSATDLSPHPTIKVLAGPVGNVFCAAFTPDNRRLVAGFYSSTALVFDLLSQTGKPICSFTNHDGPVVDVAISADGTRAASLGSWATDGTVRAWNALTGKESYHLRGNSESYSGLALSPDGARLTAGAPRVVDAWDLISGRQVLSLPVADNMNSVAWTPDLRQLSAAGDKLLRVWRVPDASSLELKQ